MLNPCGPKIMPTISKGPMGTIFAFLQISRVSMPSDKAMAMLISGVELAKFVSMSGFLLRGFFEKP